MTIIDLINCVGLENTQVQFLDKCIESAKHTKSGTLVTFGTNAVSVGEIAVGKSDKVGIVVWVPRTRLGAVMESAKGNPRKAVEILKEKHP